MYESYSQSSLLWWSSQLTKNVDTRSRTTDNNESFFSALGPIWSYVWTVNALRCLRSATSNCTLITKYKSSSGDEIPEHNATYITLCVYLLTLIDKNRWTINRMTHLLLKHSSKFKRISVTYNGRIGLWKAHCISLWAFIHFPCF